MNAAAPAEPIPFRVLLDEAMKLTRRWFGTMYLPVAVPLALLAGVVAWLQLRFMAEVSGAGSPAAMFTAAGCVGLLGVAAVTIILRGLAAAVITAAAVDAASGRPVSIKASWAMILGLPSLLTLLLAFVVIFGGFMLLIIPGIYFGLRLVFVVPVMAAEGLRGTEALGRSWRLVRYNPHKKFLDNTATKVFLIYLVAGVIAWLVSLLVTLPFAAIGGVAAMRQISSGDPAAAAAFTPSLWVQLPSTILSSLVSTAVSIYASFGLVLLYLDVVRRKEGTDLASAIDARFGGPGAIPPPPAPPA